MKYTPEQEKIISLRGKNILVSASAGSGKTFVLTQRILSLLEEGENLEEFLIFTFTKASAKDLKAKISKALPKKERRKLSQASISTIHSFCHQVMKDHFYLLGVDPQFRVGDEGSLAVMGDEVLTELLEEKYLERNPSFVRLAELFSYQLEDVIYEIKDLLDQTHLPEEKLLQILEKYRDKEAFQRFFKEHIDALEHQMFLAVDRAKSNGFLPEILEFIQEEREMLLHIGERESAPVFKSSPRIKTEDDEEEAMKSAYTDARDEYKDLAKRIYQLKKADSYELYVEHLKSDKVLETLLDLALNFSKRFEDKRKNESNFSYDDLEKMALRALDHEEVADYYRQKYKYIFVDEYQDTSQLQDDIIHKIKRENNLFLVGDVKQSIYAFRGAKPHLFLEKYHQYPKDPLSVRIELNKNFRSSKPILFGMNHIFSQVMTEEFGGLNYEKEGAFTFGREELKHWNEPIDIVCLRRNTEINKAQQEYQWIASEVKKLLQQGYSYRDMVILTSSIKPDIEGATEVFRREKLPYYVDYSQSYLDALEVHLMLNFLQVVDNFQRDLPLLSVLRLPLFNFTDDELREIRDLEPKGSYFNALCSYDAEDMTKEKIRYFLEVLRDFRQKERSLDLSQLVEYIYEKSQLESYLLALEEPVQKLANIRLLFQLAKDYEQTSLVGLNKFLLYVKKVKDRKEDFSAAKISSEDQNVLRMMSIHKSKGLQFPVVFLAGATKMYNERDLRGKVLHYDEYMSLDHVDVENRVITTSPLNPVFIDKMRKESREEEMRKLYVAMSRAEKKLYVIINATEKENQRDREFLQKISQANTFSKVILSCLDEDGENPYFRFRHVEEVVEISQEEERGLLLEKAPYTSETFESPKKRTKVSVSALLRDPEDMPISANAKSVTTGTDFHKVMEFIDFHKVKEEGVEAAYRELVDKNIVENTNLLPWVENFFLSQLGKKIILGYNVQKEVAFVADFDQTLVQGVIDLVVDTPQGVVLVDYKTDTTLMGLERHKEQLNLYAKAYEEIKNVTVIDKRIYYVRKNLWKKVEES